MQRSRLVIGLAAVFAGMTVLLVVVAAAFRSPVVAILAVTIGVATYFFWYQASGRLRASVRERARRDRSPPGARTGARARGARDARGRRDERGARGRFEGAPGGFGAGPADRG
ncbi:MAG: molecular chaperone DnaJ, partial [Haloarculaceae archaeon]